MSNRAVFVVSYADWEAYRPHLLYGPADLSRESFEALCKHLADASARRALMIAAKDPDSYRRVGWPEIVQALAEQLVTEHGFEHIDAHREIVWSGTSCIEGDLGDDDEDKLLSPELLKEIQDWNVKRWQAICGHKYGRLESDPRVCASCRKNLGEAPVAEDES